MNDLISRQAAIDAIKALYEWHDTVTEDRTIDHLKRLPSAQPETHDKRTKTHSCDCISRQAAVDAVSNMLRRKFGIGGDLAEITLAGLPSAQPDSKETSYTHKALDTISRQAAINALTSHIMPHNNEDGTVTIGVLSKSSIKNILNKLPSAQPDSKETSSTHKALDTISRQAALNALSRGSGCGASCHRAIKALPPAQPEHTSNNDCNGCKFVGCYDTDFPCANCIRKSKDYYAPERRTDE